MVYKPYQTIFAQAIIFFIHKHKEKRMSSCEKCKFRAKYDNNPQSFLGRIWKWHISWCPGWRSYTRSLSDEERKELIKKYG